MITINKVGTDFAVMLTKENMVLATVSAEMVKILKHFLASFRLIMMIANNALKDCCFLCAVTATKEIHFYSSRRLATLETSLSNTESEKNTFLNICTYIFECLCTRSHTKNRIFTSKPCEKYRF